MLVFVSIDCISRSQNALQLKKYNKICYGYKILKIQENTDKILKIKQEKQYRKKEKQCYQERNNWWTTNKNNTKKEKLLK